MAATVVKKKGILKKKMIIKTVKNKRQNKSN